MVRCEVTGKRVLPSELETCEVTGRKVISSELGKCAVTGKRACRDRLVKSVVSGLDMLSDQGVRCEWLDGPILPVELGACALSGLKVAKMALNPAGELAPLRAILDEREPGTENPKLVHWLQTQPGLGAAKTARFGQGPANSASGHPPRVVCAELRTLFGMKVRYVGLIARDGNPPVVLARTKQGKRQSGTWVTDV